MTDSAPAGSVSEREALSAWSRIAVQSFGGPAGQIAVMHRILVDEKRWFSEDEFLHALNFCMLLPGPEAQQLVTYAGWKLHGVRGGLTAGLLFVALAVPSARLTQRYVDVENYTDLQEMTWRRIEHFFIHYKDLEPGKTASVGQWAGIEIAHERIMAAIKRYKS